MANRREEERQRLREARESRETREGSSERRRLLAGYAVAGLIGLAVVVGIVIALVSSGGDGGGGAEARINQGSGSSNGVSPDNREGIAPAAVKTENLQAAAKAAGCVVRLELPDEGKTHLSTDAEIPDYKTSPPTSGDHVEPPYQQADGAYSEMPSELNIVHSLEHGRMQIQYSPDLSEEEQLELKGLYETMYGGVLLFPNSNMDYAVAATTWTNMLGCSEYKGAATLDAIRAFGKETWGRYGGEPVNAFNLKGPTPLEPAS